MAWHSLLFGWTHCSDLTYQGVTYVGPGSGSMGEAVGAASLVLFGHMPALMSHSYVCMVDYWVCGLLNAAGIVLQLLKLSDSNHHLLWTLVGIREQRLSAAQLEKLLLSPCCCCLHVNIPHLCWWREAWRLVGLYTLKVTLLMLLVLSLHKGCLFTILKN